jgi:hypothetical protein
MDYYQKYQKYKFKYYNLLKQSGGNGIEDKLNKNGLELRNVNKDHFSPEQYYKYCEIAVKNNGNALEYVVSDKMSNKQYYKICELAAANRGSALTYIVINKLEGNQFYFICIAAVKYNNLALEYVKKDEIKSQLDYYSICEVAVNKYGLALEHVDKKKINNSLYYNNVCSKAVKNNPTTLKYIDTNDMDYRDHQEIFKVFEDGLINIQKLQISSDEINKIYLKAVKFDGELLKFIPFIQNLYYEICIAAFEQALQQDIYEYKIRHTNEKSNLTRAEKNLKNSRNPNESRIKIVIQIIKDKVRKPVEITVNSRNQVINKIYHDLFYNLFFNIVEKDVVISESDNLKYYIINILNSHLD